MEKDSRNFLNAEQQEQSVKLLLYWWDQNRIDLPWRRTSDPYAIWVAEIMLQQTQVATVIPYYDRWMARFPTIGELAKSSLDEVLKFWQGLGYYSRARNLHSAAKQIMDVYNGRVPREHAQLMKLPGIGRYTAGAIASIAFAQPVPVLDGNIIRVLSRLADIPDDVTRAETRKELWQMATELVPVERPGDYNQALMELGQRVCLPISPQCTTCPLEPFCLSRERGTHFERPVRPPRKRTPHFDVVAGIIWRSQIAEDGQFLISRRPLDGMLGGLWEFPGGKVNELETREQALKREIIEELGIDIEVGRYLCTIKHAYTHFRITLHAYHAQHVAGEPQHLGVADHAWITLDDLDRFPFAVTDLRIIEALKQEFS